MLWVRTHRAQLCPRNHATQIYNFASVHLCSCRPLCSFAPCARPLPNLPRHPARLCSPLFVLFACFRPSPPSPCSCCSRLPLATLCSKCLTRPSSPSRRMCTDSSTRSKRHNRCQWTYNTQQARGGREGWDAHTSGSRQRTTGGRERGECALAAHRGGSRSPALRTPPPPIAHRGAAINLRCCNHCGHLLTLVHCVFLLCVSLPLV